jgi:hypothetical protein
VSPGRTVKDRLARAVEQASRSLSPRYEISILRNHVFHVEAIRTKEVIRIRVVLDKMTEQDEKMVRAARLPDIFTREVWVKKRNKKAFEVIEF